MTTDDGRKARRIILRYPEGDPMVSCFLLVVASFSVGASAAALTGHPLYLGLLAGWLCPSAILMVVLAPLVVRGRIADARYRRLHRHAAETMAASV
jgi:hypothetical protein